MAGVFYANPYNSTLFTTCCHVAICDDQQTCPGCHKEVYPFYKGMTEHERDEAAGGYYNHNTRLARTNMAAQRASPWRVNSAQAKEGQSHD